MTSRQRFALTMAHQAPDRPPLDLGATSLTGMRPGVQAALCQVLGFGGEPVIGHAGTDERLLEWAGTDFRAVGGIVSLPSPHPAHLANGATVDCWGIRREVVDGEAQITGHPLRGATRADLAAFPWPEPRIDAKLLAAWEARARELHRADRFVVIGEHPVFGVLELGCWMCGYDEFLLRLAAEPDFVRDFFDRVLQIQLSVIEQYYSVLGPYLDLTMSGDDFGEQRGPLLSPAMFGRQVAPFFRERIRRTRELTGCYYWHHTCGSVAALLDQLIDCGVEILNPVQTSATGMEPGQLKARFGDRLVFWGAVDVQQFLRLASPAEVTAGVRELVRVLGADGGYVSAPGHQVQDDVPPENLIAWIETVRG